MSEEIDIGQITEALNDKTDRDMQNVDTLAGADAVIEFQRPTAQNNYTWYRKYASGWVEQGGSLENISSGYVINFPVTMANARYTAGLFPYASGNYNLGYNTPTTTSIKVYTSYNGAYFSWQVSGMAMV